MRLNNAFLIYLYAFLFAFLVAASLRAQPNNDADKALDFSAIDAYFKLSSQLKRHLNPTSQEWNMYFQAPINALMLSAGALDTIEFKRNLRKAYFTDIDNATENPQGKELQHYLKYKANEVELKRHVDILKRSNVSDSILKYLCPYLPATLCRNENVPKQYYVFYGNEDATAAADMVINDLFLSYKVDRYRMGLLSAHEAFHSIVSKAFASRLVNTAGENRFNLDLLYFLSNLSQEGVADLIDKPLLMKLNSPLKGEMDKLFLDEVPLSTIYINKLDSVLRSAKGNFLYNFNYLFAHYTKHGGHIPGRVMAKAISDAGLLSGLITRVDDPVYFIELYNDAVKKGRLNLPIFSKESITYLNEIKSQCLLKK